MCEKGGGRVEPASCSLGRRRILGTTATLSVIVSFAFVIPVKQWRKYLTVNDSDDFHWRTSFGAPSADAHVIKDEGLHQGRKRGSDFFKTLNASSYYNKAFSVDFSNRYDVMKYFDIDRGHLTTDGSSACTRKDHVDIGAQLTGKNAGQERGMILRMDNVQPDCDSRGRVQISTGHLSGKFNLLYGNFTFRVRMAYAEDDTRAPTTTYPSAAPTTIAPATTTTTTTASPTPVPPTIGPKYSSSSSSSSSSLSPSVMPARKSKRKHALPDNAMSCVSLYTSKTYHNEFAICYRATRPGKVALNYWNGKDGMHGGLDHQRIVVIPKDTDWGFLEYKLEWTPDKFIYYINGKKMWEANKGNNTSHHKLPWEPQNIRLILRPTTIAYGGSPSFMAVSRMSYQPFKSSVTPHPTPHPNAPTNSSQGKSCLQVVKEQSLPIALTIAGLTLFYIILCKVPCFCKKSQEHDADNDNGDVIDGCSFSPINPRSEEFKQLVLLSHERRMMLLPGYDNGYKRRSGEEKANFISSGLMSASERSTMEQNRVSDCDDDNDYAEISQDSVRFVMQDFGSETVTTT